MRMEKTRSFLQFFRPDLEYEIVPLRDVYGPTGLDPNIHALVVSMETLPGAAASGYYRYLYDYVLTFLQSTRNAPPSHFLPSARSSSTSFLQKVKKWTTRTWRC